MNREIKIKVSLAISSWLHEASVLTIILGSLDALKTKPVSWYYLPILCLIGFVFFYFGVYFGTRSKP